jgi:hypothetical protein
MLVNVYSDKSGRSPSRAYCIFAQLTNGNVFGKLPIRDSNNRVNWMLLLVDMAKIQYTRDGERPYL